MDELFPENNLQPIISGDESGIILPAQMIRAMIEAQQIRATGGVGINQVQPASLDLRLGEVAYRIPASFLPNMHDRVVMEKLATLAYDEIDLADGAVLDIGCVYLVPLMESLALPKDIAAFANPKSSTGRIDVFTRVISDFGNTANKIPSGRFDEIPFGYKGPLYIEISPRSFPIIVRAGSRLAQMRFHRSGADKRTKGATSDRKMRALYNEIGLTTGEASIAHIIDNGLVLSVDLAGDEQTGLVGYQAKRSTDPIDVDKVQALDIEAFWQPLYKSDDKRMILTPEAFYILATREAVTIPPSHAAEMEPISPNIGEFRVHYAGFFDPGFGATLPDSANNKASRAVLEVRAREVPFILDHGQIIGRLIYKPLLEAPDLLYGGGALNSNYQGQGLRLSKHFKQADD